MMTVRPTGLALFSAVAAALAVTAVSAGDNKVEPPPEVQELDPITVEEKRPEEDQPKKVDPEKRLKEELAKDKKAIEEIKNARGQGRVKVKGPFFTYCLDYDNSNPLTQNTVGVSLIVPVYCGPGQK